MSHFVTLLCLPVFVKTKKDPCRVNPTRNNDRDIQLCFDLPKGHRHGDEEGRRGLC